MEYSADSLYINGRIYSMDPGGTAFGVMAVKDGTIVFLGSAEEGREWTGRSREVFDLGGKTVLPSFADSHAHAPGLAYDILFNVNLYEAKSKDETLRLIKAHIDANPDLPIYYGRGFNAGFFDGVEKVKGPRKEHLDRLCPDKPVILSDFGGNYFWMNSSALEKYNITADTAVPAGGVIETDDETGALWGVLREGARALVPYQSFTDEQNRAAAKWFQQVMNAYGHTSVLALRPPGTVEPRTTAFGIFKSLESTGELNMRIQGARDMDESKDIDEQLAEMSKQRASIESELIHFTTAKFFLDGVIESATGFLLEPYTAAAGKGPDYRSALVWEPGKLAYAFRRCMEEGFQIHCHTIGDGAVRAALDALQAAFDSMGVSEDRYGDYRNTLTHLQLADKADIARMAKLKVIAGVQPYWHYKSPSLWWPLEHPLIGQRAEHQYPLASFERAGVMLVASSDYPVTPEPNPFHAIQAGVTRNICCAAAYGLKEPADVDDETYLLDPSERISVDSMIRAFTVNGAYARFGENCSGSLETGKSADFIVVDRDPYATPPLELCQIRILETVFRGRAVYSADPKMD